MGFRVTPSSRFNEGNEANDNNSSFLRVNAFDVLPHHLPCSPADADEFNESEVWSLESKNGAALGLASVGIRGTTGEGVRLQKGWLSSSRSLRSEISRTSPGRPNIET